MPANYRLLRRDAPLEWPVLKATDFELGDMLWYDSSAGGVKPMGDFTWDADIATSRRNAISAFAGVAIERRTGKEDHDSVMIVPSGSVFEMVLTSATPKIGEFVGFAKASGNNIENQKLVVVTDIRDAIGYVVKRYTAATTTVEVVLFSWFDAEGGLQGRVQRSTVVANVDTTTAADLLTNYTFGRRVRLLNAIGIVSIVYSGTDVITFLNGATTLQASSSDIELTMTGALGAVVAQAIVGADGDNDIFEHDDPLDIVSDGASSSGSSTIILEYIPWPHVG